MSKLLERPRVRDDLRDTTVEEFVPDDLKVVEPPVVIETEPVRPIRWMRWLLVLGVAVIGVLALSLNVGQETVTDLDGSSDRAEVGRMVAFEPVDDGSFEAAEVGRMLLLMPVDDGSFEAAEVGRMLLLMPVDDGSFDRAEALRFERLAPTS